MYCTIKLFVYSLTPHWRSSLLTLTTGIGLILCETRFLNFSEQLLVRTCPLNMIEYSLIAIVFLLMQ